MLTINTCYIIICILLTIKCITKTKLSCYCISIIIYIIINSIIYGIIIIRLCL